MKGGPEAINRRETFRRIAGGAAVLAMTPLAANAADEIPWEGPAMSNKVLIVVGDATETVDTLYPYFRLIEGGYEPVVAGPEKRRYNMVLHEVKPGWDITREWEGYTIEARIAFRDIEPGEYLGIYVNEPCVVDGNLVSGRTFHDHGAYMGAWMAMLDAARAKARP